MGIRKRPRRQGGTVGGLPAQMVQTAPVQPTLGDYNGSAQAATSTAQTVADGAMASFTQNQVRQKQVQSKRDAADMGRHKAWFGDLG